jgi:Cof subfamily protein (haloacid dehalogenase superfamily)
MLDLSDVLIVTDLDGTFFGKRGSLVERNIEAVELLNRLGGHFTIATGRYHVNLKQRWKDMGRIVRIPIISCNGACLSDVFTDEVYAERFIDKTSAMDIIYYIKENYPTLGVRLSIPSGFLSSPDMCRASERVRREMENQDKSCSLTLPEDRWLEYDWYKIVIRGECEELDALSEDVKRLTGDLLSVNKSGATFLEFQAAGTSKATMLPYLRDICRERTGREVTLYACGDYENDIEMLKAADVAVCPSGAMDKVKAVSDLCLCDHTEGLIADLVEYIIRERE